MDVKTEKTFVVPAQEWDERVKSHFVWASYQDIKNLLLNEEFLEEKVPGIYKGNYKTLEVLKEFVYE